MTILKRTFIDSIYGQLHVRISRPEHPTKRPLLCLHQSPKSSREFVSFMKKMSRDRIVIAPDYPGYGESDPAPLDSAVTIEDYAKAAWTAVNHFQLGTVDLFGNHTGSAVAVEMAHQSPNDVGRLVLISAMMYTSEEVREALGMYKTIPLDVEGTRFSHIWSMIAKYRSPGMTLEMMSESFAENLRGGEAYEHGHYAAYAYNQHFAERISNLDHTITVINPGDMMFKKTKRVEKYLQNGKVLNFPNWGNYIVNIHEAEVLEVVRQALDVAE